MSWMSDKTKEENRFFVRRREPTEFRVFFLHVLPSYVRYSYVRYSGRHRGGPRRVNILKDSCNNIRALQWSRNI